MCVYKNIYSKELAYILVGAGKHEIHRANQQAGNSQAGAYAAVLRQNFFFIPQGNFSFALFFFFGHAAQLAVSLTRDGTHAPCSGSAES